ncbi:MAG: DUF2520 domain-containing protein [Actinomycetaceae bacterium]|nr:DUF2520 domain-containing protein [Actinomycetaceae bacterium]
MSNSFDVGIISAGKVGCALGSALRSVGHNIVGAYASSQESKERLEVMLPDVPDMCIDDIVRRSQVVIFAVPDDILPSLIEKIANDHLFSAGQIIIHTAGRYGVNVLESAAREGALTFALHPAMTFTGTSLDVARLAGCPFAVTASSLYRPIGEALVMEIGGHPYLVHEDNRSLYHAALSHGANHAVTLVSSACALLKKAGISNPGAYIRPLVEVSIEGALRSGESRLTGPIVRGDVKTIGEHCAALDALSANEILAQLEDSSQERSFSFIPADVDMDDIDNSVFFDSYDSDDMSDIAQLYRCLARITARRALKNKKIRNEQYEDILRHLGENG